MGGPLGCLQYFTAVTGTVASFNYPLGTTAIGTNPTITHLSDQNYDICFRRASGNCRLCFSPTVENAAGTVSASFGLGEAADAANNGRTGADCTADFLIIPEGVNRAAANPSATSAQANNNRICGRRFTTDNAAATPMTICTSRVPFSIKFRTNQDEDVIFKAAKRTILTDETVNSAGIPPGYLGFSLNFLQEAC